MKEPYSSSLKLSPKSAWIRDKGFHFLSPENVAEAKPLFSCARYKEYRMKNYPSWRNIRMLPKLPSRERTLGFRRTVGHATRGLLNSMGQDVLLKRKKETELEYLNGHIIRLADSVGVKAPHNRALYDLCKSEFNRAEFQPLSIEEIWKSARYELIQKTQRASA